VIIHGLRGKNALKYERIELSDLPERGLILITGPNEAGKSTVGELICLGLFGRTWALPEESIERAIRWNQRELDLELSVTAPDDKRYRIRRRLDADGDRGATLFCPVDGTEVRGWRAVTTAIEKLLGYDFESFGESFYLARREISPPHPRSETLKAMAGVLPLEEVAEELLGQVPELERRSTELADEIGEIEEQLRRFQREDLLPPQPGPARSPDQQVEEAAARREQLTGARTRIAERMPELRTATDRLVDLLDGASLARWEARTEAMDGALDSMEEAVSWLGYSDVVPGTDKLSGFLDRVQSAIEDFAALVRKGGQRRAWIGGMLGEPGAEPMPGSLAEDEYELELRQQRARTSRRRSDGLALGALVLAAAALVIGFVPIEGLNEQVRLGGRAVGVLMALGAGLFAWARHSASVALRATLLEEGELQDRRESLESDGRLLDGLAGRPLPDAVAALEQLSDGAIQEDLTAFLAGVGGRLVRAGLKEKLEDAVEGRMVEVEKHLDALRDRIASDVEVLGRIHDLRGHKARLLATRREVADRLETFELSSELALGAARNMTHEFNAEVRQGMARVLPALTEGRYQYLQIGDDDLAVRVFSSQKQDFVAFEEISGGTQRQIELATRIALSEALVRNSAGGRQFLFLDEPFAFFDTTRTMASVQALPKLSDQLPQIWIAAQAPPAGARPDVHLELSLALETLIDPDDD
jgi:DNA repair protein SbcC/Rad50